MSSYNKNSLLIYNDEIYSTMFSVNVLVNATICSCQDKEFRGEYYGIPQKFINKISNERNEYISLLTLLSDKIRNVHKLNHCIERELTLH